jgi:hypothetical protein
MAATDAPRPIFMIDRGSHKPRNQKAARPGQRFRCRFTNLHQPL